MHAPLAVAYGFDSQTRALIGEVNAYLDPMASGPDAPVYTLPANATWVAPPIDALAEFTRLEYRGDAWQVAADREALSKEIERRRTEADAQVSVLDDTALLLSEDVLADPENAGLQAELKQTKVAASAWKRYRLTLVRMAAGINTLDVSVLAWPVRPAE